MDDKINLYDINIISEDFFAGLLNLIYGYELKNANHEKRNAKAIDLFDRKNRITVQITSDINKIQKTIDKYIEHEMYLDYDRLVFLLLRNKPNYRKKFDTKGLLNFEIRRDIMDINDLVEKIRTLDTKMLMDIDEYCAVEIVGYKQDDNMKINEIKQDNNYVNIEIGGCRQYNNFNNCNNIEIDEYRQSSKKRNPIRYIFFGMILALLIIGYIVLQNMRIAHVYASNIYPYTQAGIYSSCNEFPTLYKNEIEANKAFAIMSNIRNDGEKSSSVEQLYCDILSLEPIEKAVIKLDAVIKDNELYIFAFNDGWGSGKALVIKSAVLTGQDIDIGIEEFSQSIDYAENAELKSAGGVLLAKYVLDSELLKHYYEEHDLQCLNLHINAEGKDGDVTDIYAYLDLVEDEFCLKYDDIGGVDYRIQLFAVLDVDQNPKAIYFTGKDATPSVEDRLNIETVLAPTKSCIVKCRNVFSVNGKRQQTDDYTAKVTVPVFDNNAINRSGLLTQELAKLQQIDEMSIDRAVQKYLYKPESIIDYADDQ